MEKVAISEIKNRLSAYLRKVKAGQVVVIMDRDQPVARLERIGADAHQDDRLRRLEQAGLLRPARRPLRPAVVKGKPPKARQSVLDALLDEHARRRCPATGRGDRGDRARARLPALRQPGRAPERCGCTGRLSGPSRLVIAEGAA
ncbi:MAG: type II toxin-antitoxin system prevent-host-death family antitoxin [Gammaproteobacteria bacterium]|nr:type II toxin-antitoxin system prevent-host-death family antitoxin [Gammaproteobacteria bacterium]